jgi:hypothetical protein
MDNNLSYTPLPWVVGNHGMIYTEDLRIAVAETANLEGVEEEDVHGNAAFIVRAVNSHEALLRIARRYAELCEKQGSDPEKTGLAEIIARAEGSR